MPNDEDIHYLYVHVYIREMPEGAVVESVQSISQSVFVAYDMEGQEHLVGFGAVSGQRAWVVLTKAIIIYTYNCVYMILYI